MKEYVIISNTQRTEVEQKVIELLNQGWKLAGGVSVAYKHEHADDQDHSYLPGHLVFSQALEKEG